MLKARKFTISVALTPTSPAIHDDLVARFVLCSLVMTFSLNFSYANWGKTKSFMRFVADDITLAKARNNIFLERGVLVLNDNGFQEAHSPHHGMVEIT